MPIELSCYGRDYKELDKPGNSDNAVEREG